MNSRLNQQLMMAIAFYPDVLALVASMLQQHAAALGLMTPGLPEQLAVPNGVDVTANGVPLYYVAVKRRNEQFRSQMAFGKAIQEAIDATCYANCVPPLVLLRVEQLLGGYIGLTLTIGGW
ncbi:hypothetical protein D1641_08870 [Colidextribacter sp. OB.20]|nr:hypothetical protein [Colidextribacter sp. OB.20]